MNKTKDIIDLEKRFQIKHSVDYQHAIISRFKTHFGALGFKEMAPVSIVSQQDHSVRFTGSTTNVFKKQIIKSSKLKDDYFCCQPCLRTQNQTAFFNDKISLNWASYFTEIGTLSPVTELYNVAEETVHFLTNIKLLGGRLKINISSIDEDLLKCIKAIVRKFKISVEIDNHDLPYYRHTYGLEKTIGRNFNFMVLNQKTHKFEDIGTFILIEKSGKPIAIETGFGVSTLIARAYGLINSIQASVICEIIPFSPGFAAKFADALSVAVVMLRAGIKPGSRDKGRLLRTYLLALLYLKKKLNISIEDSVDLASEFETKEFNESTIDILLDKYLKEIFFQKKENLTDSP